MYHAVLIAPRTLPLDGTLADSLRGAWGGDALDWLAPGEAVQFALPAVPGNLDSVRADVSALSVDLAVVADAGRRKRMLLADMDSTMIEQECIDELAEMAGVGARVRAITARAMNGEIDFDGALRARVALLAGLPATIIDRVLAERITYTPGGAALLATMRAHGGYAALVSGGFTAFTAAVAGRLGFDEHHANTLETADGALTGTVGAPILGRQAKVDALDRITAARGLTAGDVIAVGDGANDLGMLGRAGLGVALHAKPAVAAQCDLRINHADLTALLYIQGYRRANIVA